MRFVWSHLLFQVFLLSVVVGDVRILQGDQLVTVGQTRFLSCEVDGGDDDGGDDEKEVEKVVWKKNGDDMEGSDSITMWDEEREMMINEVADTDAGSYQCRVTFKEGETQTSEPIKFTLFQNIKFMDCADHIAFEKGTTGVLECGVDSVPKARLLWERDDVTVTKTDAKLEAKRNVLKLTDLELGDSGVYSLVAKQMIPGIIKKHPISVTVFEKVVVDSSSGEVNVTEGDVGYISCRASGHPSPDFKFFKGSNSSQNLEELEGFSVERKGSEAVLSIRNTTPDHMGDILCEAFNLYSKDHQTFFLNVLQAPKVISFENVTSKESEKLEITCHAYANPPPYIEIGRVLDGEGDTMKQRSEAPTTSFTFSLDSNSLSNEGEYYCLATHDGNSHFDDHQTTNYVEVIYKPMIEEDKNTKIAKTWVNNPVQLVCVARANPPATISWTTEDDDKKEVNFSFEDHSAPQDKHHSHMFTGYTSHHHDHYYHSHITVLPTNKDKIARILKCNASNDLGSVEDIFEIQEAFAPEPPTIGNIVDLRATSFGIQVEVVDDGGAPVTHYNTLYYEEGKRAETETGMNFTATDEKPAILRIKGLTQKTSYMVEVVAVNGVGAGEASITNATTKDRGIPSKVNITMEPFACHDMNKVNVRWTEPYSSGLPINMYQVLYRKVTPAMVAQRLRNETDNSSDTEWQTIQTTETSITLTSFEESSQYELYVLAHNDVGWSQQMQLLSFNICKGGPVQVILLGYDRLPVHQASRGKASSIHTSYLLLTLTSLNTLIWLASS